MHKFHEFIVKFQYSIHRSFVFFAIVYWCIITLCTYSDDIAIVSKVGCFFYAIVNLCTNTVPNRAFLPYCLVETFP